MLDVFAKAAKIESAKNSLAENFLPDLIELINANFEQKAIVRNGFVSSSETPCDLLG